MAPAPAPAAVSNPFIIEQYKAKLTDLGNLGVRQTTMSTYYVTIISAFLGVLAFKDRSLAQIDAAVIWAICAPGILVSTLWFTGVGFFRNLFRAKLQMLEKIEKALPFETFREEFETMKKHGRQGWLSAERYVPLVFALTFAGILCARFLRP
jgi:hypothetical protein